MSSLACVAAEVNESTGSAFLIAFQQHAAAMGFFRPIADRVTGEDEGGPVQRPPEGSDPGGFDPARVSVHEQHQPPPGARLSGGAGVGNGALPRSVPSQSLPQPDDRRERGSAGASASRAAALALAAPVSRTGARGYQLSAALASAPGCEPEAIASYLDLATSSVRLGCLIFSVRPWPSSSSRASGS